MEENKFSSPKQKEPKDLIGTAGQKQEIAQKVVASGAPLNAEDPYGGTLKKTNILVFACLTLSVCAFMLGLFLMIYYVVKFSSAGTTMTFEKIRLGLFLLIFGFVLMIVFALLRSLVEKKRRNAYTSTHQNKTFEQFKPKEVETESAKKGQSTSETTLTITETKEDFKYCPHCHARIPKETGMFCPKCGKRLNAVPMND